MSAINTNTAICMGCIMEDESDTAQQICWFRLLSQNLTSREGTEPKWMELKFSAKLAWPDQHLLMFDIKFLLLKNLHTIQFTYSIISKFWVSSKCKAVDHTQDSCPQKQKSIQVVENEVIIDQGIRQGSMEKVTFELYLERQEQVQTGRIKRKENKAL